MSTTAPALAPLFRSQQQMRILAVLFAESVDELSIGDLARRADVAQATASREVARLAEHGLVLTHNLGRNTLVGPNWTLPWAKELRSILVQTVGVLGQLAESLAPVNGIDEAYVFGSWAARYLGDPGPQPRDIDVVVVGDASLRSLRRACSKVERELRVEINPVVIDRARWTTNKPEPFVKHLRDQPIVAIPVTRS